MSKTTAIKAGSSSKQTKLNLMIAKKSFTVGNGATTKNHDYSNGATNFLARVGNYVGSCANSCTVYIVQGGAESLKGSHRMGDGRIFLKTSSPLSFIKTCRMNLLSARSISLNSTFSTLPQLYYPLGETIDSGLFRYPSWQMILMFTAGSSVDGLKSLRSRVENLIPAMGRGIDSMSRVWN